MVAGLPGKASSQFFHRNSLARFGRELFVFLSFMDGYVFPSTSDSSHVNCPAIALICPFKGGDISHV
jgi:hypothetical protein